MSLLVSALCQRHGPMFGVTVAVERGGGIWDAGMTVIADTEMAEKTLAELGWGREEKTVWLIAKRF